MQNAINDAMQNDTDFRQRQILRDWKDTFILSRNPLPPPLWIAERAAVDAATICERFDLELLDKVRNERERVGLS